jgi:hypothetical protein
MNGLLMVQCSILGTRGSSLSFFFPFLEGPGYQAARWRRRALFSGKDQRDRKRSFESKEPLEGSVKYVLRDLYPESLRQRAKAQERKARRVCKKHVSILHGNCQKPRFLSFRNVLLLSTDRCFFQLLTLLQQQAMENTVSPMVTAMIPSLPISKFVKFG